MLCLSVHLLTPLSKALQALSKTLDLQYFSQVSSQLLLFQTTLQTTCFLKYQTQTKIHGQST